MEKFNWIKRFYENRKEGGTWISVSDIIPNEFDDYFLIHWNVGIVENFPFDDFPEKNDIISKCPQIIDTFRQDYFPFKEFKKGFNKRIIQAFFKFLKQKISSVKSVDYSRSLT